MDDGGHRESADGSFLGRGNFNIRVRASIGWRVISHQYWQDETMEFWISSSSTML